MKTTLPLLAAALLLLAPSLCLAMMDIERVTPARAKELGIIVRWNAAGPQTVRIMLEFPKTGEFKGYSRVDLELMDQGRLILSSTLAEEKSDPGQILTSFAADRTGLDKLTVRIVIRESERSMTGYDLRVSDFVDLTKAR